MAETGPGLNEILRKIYENKDMIVELAYADSWGKAFELAKKLEERLGISVFVGVNDSGVYPALVIDVTGWYRGTIAWLEITRTKRIVITEKMLRNRPLL